MYTSPNMRFNSAMSAAGTNPLPAALPPAPTAATPAPTAPVAAPTNPLAAATRNIGRGRGRIGDVMGNIQGRIGDILGSLGDWRGGRFNRSATTNQWIPPSTQPMTPPAQPPAVPGSPGYQLQPTGDRMGRGPRFGANDAFRGQMDAWRDARPERPEGFAPGWGGSAAMDAWRASRPTFRR